MLRRNSILYGDLIHKAMLYAYGNEHVSCAHCNWTSSQRLRLSEECPRCQLSAAVGQPMETTVEGR
jgi:uncharacterized paraquat-inducible protein A